MKDKNKVAKENNHLSFDNFEDPFESIKAPDLPRPQSACAKQKQRSSILKNSTCDQEEIPENFSNEYAATAQKKRPSTARASISSLRAAQAEISASNRDSSARFGDMPKCATPTLLIHDRNTPKVPGLEMAGVTAEQLDEAGMLYIDEEILLQGKPTLGGAKGNSGAKKPPSGQNHKSWRNKASAMQTAMGLAKSAADPAMCKACLLQPCSGWLFQRSYNVRTHSCAYIWLKQLYTRYHFETKQLSVPKNKVYNKPVGVLYSCAPCKSFLSSQRICTLATCNSGASFTTKGTINPSFGGRSWYVR